MSNFIVVILTRCVSILESKLKVRGILCILHNRSTETVGIARCESIWIKIDSRTVPVIRSAAYFERTLSAVVIGSVSRHRSIAPAAPAIFARLEC